MRLKATTIGFLLVATGLSSFALTFGRVQGAAWIGQPLNLVVPVQVDPGQTAASLCAQADVFHADTKQDSNRVQVSVDPSTQPDTFLVRVSSNVLVDEPVVTVYLRTGCEQKNTRRFVLLADFPTEGAPLAPRLAAQALEQVPTIAPVESAAAAQPVSKAEAKPEPKPEAKAAAKPAPEAVAKKPVAKPAAKPAVKAEPPPKPAASPAPAAVASPAQKGPRLKLDPLEVLAERVQSLESTSTAQPPQDQAQDAQRMQQLQNDVRALLEQAGKNEASLLLMRQRLEKAESEQVPMGLVYGLVALLALALAGLAAMWSQRKKSAPWQAGAADASGPVTVAPLVHEDAWHSQPVTVSPVATAAAKDAEIDVNMIEMDEALFKAPAKASAAPQASLPAQAEQRSGHPEFSSDSVLDAIQGAEFFAKLGKTDEAIQTLESTIRADGTGSALLYLELMRIAQDKSLKTDFRQFRDEFQEKFNATVPEFALFRDEGKGLEGRPELLEHICRTWSSPNVLEVLESCILREPFDKSPKPFDLAAFRELVLLHGIALHHAAQAKAKPTKEEEHVIDFEL
jgi:pilus assembly protein FimV